jgi:ribosomal protein L6P/L9E
MITASQAFQTAMKAPVKTIGASVYNSADGITYDAGDALQSIVLHSAGYYFGTNTRSVTIKLLGSGYSLVEKSLEVSLNVVTNLSTGDRDSISYGTFVVYEQETDLEKGITTAKAYDVIGALGLVEYQAGELTFPCTVANLASQIATRFNLTLGTDFTTLPNYDYTITEDLYANINGETYRDIIAEIAGATATLAKVSVDGELLFVPLQTTVDDTLTYATMKKFKFGAHYGPVNSIVLSRMPQEDNIAVTDDESVAANGLTEVKLANNEILDDDRQSLAQPILDAADGFSFSPLTITTVGLGWFEVGDRIQITDDSTNTYETILTDISLTLDGGIQEVLTSAAPTETQTNYSLAGGITKTIYNTEIKVDKQNRQIMSIIEEHTRFENEVMSNFSSIVQNIASIVTSIQNSGGNNLIKNSAMYAKDENGIPLSWTFSGTGTWDTTPSADASANGSLSGQVISLAGETVSQIVTVKPDDDGIAEDDKTYYSFSCRIKKTAVGDCTVTLSDGTQEGVWTITVPNGEAVNYKEYAVEALLPHSTELTVSVTASNDAEFYITDMMLAVGSFRSQWTQANGEFSNSQVQIDSDGVTVKNSNLAGAFTKVTPQGVEVYLNSQLIALINSDTIKAPIGEFTKEIDMPPIKVVAQSDGWAFVEKED